MARSYQYQWLWKISSKYSLEFTLHSSIYPTYPIHITSAYKPVPTSQYLFITYPNLHFPTLYYCQGLIKYKAETIYQIKPKQPRPKRFRAEMTQGWNERPENAVAVVEQERTCRVVHLIIWLSILFGCEYSGLLIYLLWLCSLILMILAQWLARNKVLNFTHLR